MKKLQKILLSFFTVIIASAAIVGLTHAYRVFFDRGEDQEFIGGHRDDHGCLGSAGYTWCEAKEKCLRTWEEACTVEDALRNYLRDNLSELSPEPEVLGGKFYVTSLTMDSPTRAIVEYEDGHNAFRAAIIFTVDSDLKIEVHKFSLQPEYQPVAGNDNPAVIALKKIFAEKYDYEEEDIEIDISIDHGEYIRGGVRFGAIDGPGSGGIFFATMKDGEYVLVYDGNGGVDCSLLTSYNFPEDMRVGCYE